MTRFFYAALALACIVLSAFLWRTDTAVLAAALPWLMVCAWGAVIALYANHLLGDRLAALVAVAFVLVFGWPAMAQTAATVAQPATDTAVVTVPLGTWVASYAQAVVEIVTAIVMAAVTWGLRRLPATVAALLKGVITHQIVERAVAFGVNTVADAAKGKALNVAVGSTVLANALNYVVQNAPSFLLKWLGGPSAIRDHIIAMLPMEDGASLAHATPTALGHTTADPVKALAA